MKKRLFLAYKGGNETTGTPNAQTGLYSQYGDIHRFSTKDARDDFVNDWRNNDGFTFSVSVTRRSGRQYYLGMSMRAYNEYIDELFFVDDDHYPVGQHSYTTQSD